MKKILSEAKNFAHSYNFVIKYHQISQFATMCKLCIFDGIQHYISTSLLNIKHGLRHFISLILFIANSNFEHITLETVYEMYFLKKSDLRNSNPAFYSSNCLKYSWLFCGYIYKLLFILLYYNFYPKQQINTKEKLVPSE